MSYMYLPMVLVLAIQTRYDAPIYLPFSMSINLICVPCWLMVLLLARRGCLTYVFKQFSLLYI